MLCYDRIDVSEGIDVNKTIESKECGSICHYWYFLKYSFKFQPNGSNRCHDLLTISVNLSDIAILNIKVSYYCCIITSISKWSYKFITKFHQHKGPTSIKNIDINKIVICNKVSFGKKEFKYFIGYKDAKKIKP